MPARTLVSLSLVYPYAEPYPNPPARSAGSARGQCARRAARHRIGRHHLLGLGLGLLGVGLLGLGLGLGLGVGLGLGLRVRVSEPRSIAQCGAHVLALHVRRLERQRPLVGLGLG